MIREEIGGAVGVRWARATRSGPALDPAPLQRWLDNGRLHAVEGSRCAFRLIGWEVEA